MIRKLQLLTPAFLQKLDRYLLLNRPGIWATKIHFVLFIGLCGLGLAFLKASFAPISVADVPDAEAAFGLLFIPVALIVGLWAYFVYLFRTDRNYGQISPVKEWRTQGIYLLGLTALVAIPFVYGYSLSANIKHSVSDTQFQKDLLALNMGEAYFSGNHPSFDTDWEYHLNNRFATHAIHGFEYEEMIVELQQASTAQQMAHIQSFIQTFEKYSGQELPVSAGLVMENFTTNTSSYQYAYEDMAYQVERNLSRIAEAKMDRTVFVKRNSLNFLVFALLFVGFTFMIFVRSNWKQFLLALTGSIGSAILLALFAEWAENMVPAFSSLREPTIFTFGMGLLVTALMFVVFSKRNSKGFVNWKSVSLIMTAGLTPVLMMLVIASLDGEHIYNTNPRDIEFTSIILGIFGLTFLLWNAVFSKRFREIQASPTSN